MSKSTAMDKFIKILTHAKDKSSETLQKYDILIAGGFLGATMTKNISQKTHGHKTVFASYLDKEPGNSSMRTQYELKRFDKSSYFSQINTLLCPSVAKCGGVGIKSFHPKDNYVTLNNGREVQYGVLINAMGIKPDINAVSGFKEALDNPNAPVYSNLDSAIGSKYYSFVPLFSHGDAFVYIPPFPFSGEVEGYNFLIAIETWQKSVTLGQVSPLHSLTIINANDRFASKSDKLDAYIKEKLESYGVKVLYNTKLSKVDGEKQELTLENGKTHWFNNLYVHAGATKNEAFEGSGLLNKDGLTMPVDPKTLQHPEYNNIFGIGDINDLNIQKGFLAGVAQSHVVRHNALRTLRNLSPNAEYNGYSKIDLYTGLNKLVTYTETYDKGETLSTSFPVARYYLATKLGGKKNLSILKGKNPGPPKGKLGYQKFADEKETHKEHAH